MENLPDNRQSIRRTLTRQLALALTVIGLIGAGAASLLGNRYANLAYDRALSDDVATLANQVEIRNGELHVNLPQAARAWLIADQGDEVRYRVIDLKNHRILDANGNLGNSDNKEHIQGQAYFRDETIGNTDFRIAYMRRVVDPSDWPVLVEVGESLGNRNKMNRQIVAAAVLLISTMIAVAVWLVRQGVKKALAPLAQLEQEAALRSSSNLLPLDPMLAPHEVRGLIRSINQMMRRVSESIDSQNRFIANAAHQLRTPVAGLRLQAQIALKGGSPETVSSSLRDIEDSATRAAHLIEQLLVLSKADAASGLDLTSELVDLTNLAQRVIEHFIPQAIRNNIDLGFDGPADGVIVRGNEILLHELLSNLVDNALRYGKPIRDRGTTAGQVTVSVRYEKDEVLLSVADEGPGVSEVEQDRLFQRFYRPDSATSSQTNGAGLGLAIVKEIADRHDARIVISSTPISQEGSECGGCTITIRFPGP